MSKEMRLKVCPFCGAEGKYSRPGPEWQTKRMWASSCPYGHASSPDLDTQKAARDWWNRRYTGPQYPKRLDLRLDAGVG